MSLTADLTLGRFLPGDSSLHRLDPRLKLAALPALMVAVFAAPGWSRLGVLALCGILLVPMGRIPWSLAWRGLWCWRWLLLFTLLLHLFFTPGHTLWGLTWLSRDGLERGGLVCLQLLLAFHYSSVLSLTTTPRRLADACAVLLRPLERFGVPVREWVGGLAGVLHFLPLLREEAENQWRLSREGGDDPGRGPWLQRAAAVARLLAALLLRLVERAEALAQAEAKGEGGTLLPAALSPPGFSLYLTLAVILGFPAALLIWL